MLMPAFLVKTGIKGEGHSRKLTFSFSTHRSARYPEEILLERPTSEASIETVLAARVCLCDVIRSDSKLAGRRKICN